MNKLILIFLCLSSHVFSINVGNPSNPKIFKKGFFTKKNFLNFKSGYLFDNTYKSSYKDEILTEDSTPSYSKIISNNLILTLNFKKRLDIYSILGSAKLNLDEQIKTNGNLSWGVGSKLLFFKKKGFDLAADIKYFRTRQHIDYFIIEKKVFPIETSHFAFTYEELQGSLALSYKVKRFIPYIGITYLRSIISPHTGKNLLYSMFASEIGNKGLIRYPYPNQDVLDDFTTSKIKNSKNIGLVVGSSIINSSININIESRMFDQNAINISSEVRF